MSVDAAKASRRLAIYEECRPIGGCLIGDAVITTGGNLRVRGYLKEVGNRKPSIARCGRVIGYHHMEKDQTILPRGRRYGYGDQLMDLLED